MKQRAYETVDKILRDLTDRRGLRQAWEQIDEGVCDEIRECWTDIILGTMTKTK